MEDLACLIRLLYTNFRILVPQTPRGVSVYGTRISASMVQGFRMQCFEGVEAVDQAPRSLRQLLNLGTPKPHNPETLEPYTPHQVTGPEP